MKSRLLLATALAIPLVATAEAPKVQERLLDNGLKVLVKEDHRAPIVTSQVWYKVGSSYEHGGLTGVSHLLEHMMFKGTEKLAPGEFSRIIAANGGDENAFTGRDYTAYFQTLAADRLPISFELEAQRMRFLTLPEEEFLKELEVVKEERRMRTEDDPESLAYEQFNATAYEASPYRIPVIGWATDLEDMKVADLRDWYRQWYAPNNATLVVVGDVDPEEVFCPRRKAFRPSISGASVGTQTRWRPDPAWRETHQGQGPRQGTLSAHGLQVHRHRSRRGGLGALCPGNAVLGSGRGVQRPVQPRTGARLPCSRLGRRQL